VWSAPPRVTGRCPSASTHLNIVLELTAALVANKQSEAWLVRRHPTDVAIGDQAVTEHVLEELSSLLFGQATSATVFIVAVHLRNCVDCHDALVDTILAHASLSASARLLIDGPPTTRVPQG
jgi:hypothetical protein